MAFGLSFIPSVDFFEFVLFFVERLPAIVAVNFVVAVIVWRGLTPPDVPEDLLRKPVNGKKPSKSSSGGPFHHKLIKWLVALATPLTLGVMVLGTILGSYEDAYVTKKYDKNLPSMRAKLEHYIETGVIEPDAANPEPGTDITPAILDSGKYAPTFGKYEIGYLLKDLLTHTLFHWDSHNAMNMPIAYNKGNDWFKATLGESMVYTSGLFPTGTESLVEAQFYKLDYVADAIELQPTDKVLDIGCGWGPLVERFTNKYGASVTGITLSSSQREYALELNKEKIATGQANIVLQDAMLMKSRTDLIPEGGYDKITSLEMAEHVGIRRYQEFLTTVHSLLKDDGVFYLQVAGLRRAFQYEDLVWGLFMGEHIFPGADASCPLGWVTSQVERSGFEIQRVNNLGNHYSQTLYQWLQTWYANKDMISEKYGIVAWRRWEVFLAWSVRVAREGSSTVFMLTLTKAGQTPARVNTQAHIDPKVLNGPYNSHNSGRAAN